jgi:hypothetical protein
MEVLPDTRTATYAAAIDTCVAMGPKMLFVVIPTEVSDLYPAVKKKLCCEAAIPSQVVTHSKVLKKVSVRTAQGCQIFLGTKQNGKKYTK